MAGNANEEARLQHLEFYDELDVEVLYSKLFSTLHKSNEVKYAGAIIKNVTDKQKLLFSGYIQNECKTHTSQVPVDIVNLCSAFYHINITLTLTNKSKNKNYTARDITTNDLYKFSMQCFKQCELHIAHELLQNLISFEKDDYKYHNALGLVLDKWDINQVAEQEFIKAIELKPKSHIFKWNYGLLLYKQAKYELAVKQFVKSSEMDPIEPEYFSKAAECYVELKDYDNAQIFHLKSIEIAPDKACYYMEYAKFLCKIKKYQQAQIHFNIAMEMEPDNWKQIYQAAKYLRDYSKDYKTSEIYYKKCLKLNNVSYVNSSYGYLLYLMKNYKQSEKYLSYALEITDPKYGKGGGSWAFYYYGLLQYQLGNIEKSYDYLNQSLMRISNISYIMSHVEVIKEQDGKNMEYHLRYERMLKEKFKSN